MLKVIVQIGDARFPASELHEHITRGTTSDGVEAVVQRLTDVRCPRHGEGTATVHLRVAEFIWATSEDECCAEFKAALGVVQGSRT